MITNGKDDGNPGFSSGVPMRPDAVEEALRTLAWLGYAPSIRSVGDDGTVFLYPGSPLSRVMCGPWTPEADEVYAALGSLGYTIEARVALSLSRPNWKGE